MRRPPPGLPKLLTLGTWYATYGRHDLPWRQTRDRWAMLVSEVMLAQTQVARVAAVWPAFMDRFPTPAAMAAASPGDVILAWGNLGYPRRARRLWDSAALITTTGWPDDLTVLPGVGRYTAAAVIAQAEPPKRVAAGRARAGAGASPGGAGPIDRDLPAVETNIRRVLERRSGRRLTSSAAEAAFADAGSPLTGRDRLLALMDVGALLCRPRAPRCDDCPLSSGCAIAAGTAAEDPATLGRPARQARFEGSFRQRRGRVLAALRDGPQPVDALDADALAALVADGLATVAGPLAHLPD